MTLAPITLSEAREFVRRHHRHNLPPRGHRYSIAITAIDELFDAALVQGVVIVGRPVARHLDDGCTAEVVRCCVSDQAPKGSCSMLYRAAWRAWKEMGGHRLVTYTLLSESGASLRGAGFLNDDGPSRVQPSDKWTNRPGRVAQSVVGEPKQRWSISR